MSSLALIGLVVVIVAVAVAFYLILSGDREFEDGDDNIAGNQAQYWQEQLDEKSRDFGLAATRGVATKWAASAAAILGVLATVAVVAGPSDLAEDVGGTEALVAGVLVLLAGAVAAVATLLAALAEQGTPMSEQNPTAGRLRHLTRLRAKRAASQIWWSRLLTMLALCLLLSGAAVAWLTALTGPEDASAESALVVDGKGTHCGELTRGDDGKVVLLENEVVVEFGSDARVTLVDSCPEIAKKTDEDEPADESDDGEGA